MANLEPGSLFNWNYLFTWKGLFLFVGGGFFIGFGTRYAGGCTSGHAITGLSNLQLPSLIAVIGFFIGGLFTTWLLFPIIIQISIMKTIKYILTGILFGIIMTKSEAVSWYRIQEMFRFQSIFMYGIIGTAVITGYCVDCGHQKISPERHQRKPDRS